MSDGAPKLTWAFDLTIEGDRNVPFKATEHSATCCGHVTSGTLVSADGKTRLIVKAGTDWMTVNNRYAAIDARVCCESATAGPEALNVDIAYLGRCELSNDAAAVLTGGDTPVKRVHDCYYYTTPYLSSRSAELSWVNGTVFLATGNLTLTNEGNPTVRYRIYRVG